MSSESGDEIFITQSTYIDHGITEGNIVECILSMEENYPQLNVTPTFTIKSDLFSDISDFEEEDNDALITSTQEAEERAQKQRFSSIMTDRNVQYLLQSAVPKNTKSKDKWAVNLFESWQTNRNNLAEVKFKKSLLLMSDAELNNVLTYLVGEVRNQSGNEYQPKTLYEIIMSLQHYLRLNDRIINFLEDPAFSTMKRVLDSRMKDLSKKG